ncbi:serine hydrolase [Bdellovibrionota bacterium FG-2]
MTLSHLKACVVALLISLAGFAIIADANQEKKSEAVISLSSGSHFTIPTALFMIGSMTKSLTTLMMAKLVDQNKMKWTTPVQSL